jgi:hypothetical protein
MEGQRKSDAVGHKKQSQPTDYDASLPQELYPGAFLAGPQIQNPSLRTPLNVIALQRTIGNQAVARLMGRTNRASDSVKQMAVPNIQRAPDKDDESKPVVFYYVIGDKKLNMGGGAFLRNMEALKSKLLQTQESGEWTLVITMHGAEEFFSNSMRALSTGGPGTYDKDAIENLFTNDVDFQNWRKKHGPSKIRLLSCQIGASLEKTFMKAVLKPGAKQSSHGLGAGCILQPEVFNYTNNGKAIKTRAQYKKLKASEKEDLLESLSDWNDKYGYNGDKVSKAQLLNYFFDVVPKGEWVAVSIVKGKTQIPYVERMGKYRVQFMKMCTQGINNIGNRTPTAPSVDE